MTASAESSGGNRPRLSCGRSSSPGEVGRMARLPIEPSVADRNRGRPLGETLCPLCADIRRTREQRRIHPLRRIDRLTCGNADTLAYRTQCRDRSLGMHLVPTLAHLACSSPEPLPLVTPAAPGRIGAHLLKQRSRNASTFVVWAIQPPASGSAFVSPTDSRAALRVR